MKRLRVIDSHTEGEPTRVLVMGAPEIEAADAAERLAVLRAEHDWLRRTINGEPRAGDALVSAVLCGAARRGAVGQVIYCNNAGYLGMCVHGTMGVAATLVHLGRIEDGMHVLETPVGEVHFEVLGPHHFAVQNVRSYRFAKDVRVTTERHGTVTGDIAWGGNWFFLVKGHGQVLRMDRLPALSDCAADIKSSLSKAKITGSDGAEIDHVELFADPQREDADSKNFVLCPGLAYDRSPCGTGTSAKLACLAADGELPEGATWRQESIVGSLFEGSYRKDGDAILPKIRGHAYITADATLLLDPDDPYQHGIQT